MSDFDAAFTGLLAEMQRWQDDAARAPEPPSPCPGLCVTAYDLGADEYGDMIAYAHPDCPVHGDDAP